MAAGMGTLMGMRRTTTALTACLLLALPGSALAQSAGDDQYQDPFPQEQQQPQQQTQQPTAPTGGDSGGGTPPTAAAPIHQPSGATAAADTQTAAPAPGTGKELPRTGFEGLPLVIAGLVMVGAGVLLRLSLWTPPADARGGLIDLNPYAPAPVRGAVRARR